MVYIMIAAVVIGLILSALLALIGPAIVCEIKLLIHDFHWF